MDIILELGGFLLAILLSVVLPFIVIRFLLRFLFEKENAKNIFLIYLIFAALTTIFVWFFVITYSYNSLLEPPVGYWYISDREEYELLGINGKLIYNIPDTIILNTTEKISIRISKANIRNHILLKTFDGYEGITEESIPLSSVMKVDLVESSTTNKTIINRINNNSEQLIDTTRFTEWVFDVTPIDYGDIELTVSVSQIRELKKYGKNYYDIPIYEKKVMVYASNIQKAGIFWDNNYFSVLSILSLFIFLVSKLIPKSTKISINMTNEKQTDFWNAGSLGLAIYVVTIMSIAFFKMFNISLYFVPLVFGGTILIYALFTAVSLRDNDKISEDNFMTLMGMAIKKVPPMNWIFKDKN